MTAVACPFKPVNVWHGAYHARGFFGEAEDVIGIRNLQPVLALVKMNYGTPTTRDKVNHSSKHKKS